MANSKMCHEFGRAAKVASVEVGMPLDPDYLSQPFDATLAGMTVTGYVLSGIEYIDGCAYASVMVVSTGVRLVLLQRCRDRWPLLLLRYISRARTTNRILQ